MPAAETARLIASLTLDSKGFDKGLSSAERKLGALESTSFRVGQHIGSGTRAAIGNIAKLGLVAATGIGAAVKTGLDDLAALESAITSVDGAIETLNLTGQITGKEVAQWADEIERDIGAAFDDKEITAAAATLLRYGQVAPKNLRPALEVMTDLAAKTGSVEGASTLLAKALADPTKAAGKLARVGIILTKAQQDQIKAMVEAGNVAGAQTILLDALAKSTEGAARASQGPYARSLAILADVGEDARKALAEGFLPVIQKVADRLGTAMGDPAFINGIREFGKTLAAGLDDLIDIATKLPWTTIGDSLKIAGAGAKTLLQAFTSLPPWVQTAVITGWGLNKLTGGALGGIVGELGKGLIKGVLGIQAAQVNITAANVTGVGGGVPAVAGKGAGVASLIPAGFIATAIIAAAVPIGEAFASALPDWLKGPGGQGQSEAQRRITEARGNITTTFESPKLQNTLKSLPQNVAGAVAGAVGGASASTTAELTNQRVELHEANRLSREQLQAFRDGKVSKSDIAAIPKLLTFYQTSVHPSQESLATDMAALKSIQASLLASGDTKTAATVATAITDLQAVIDGATARETAAITAATKEGDAAVRERIEANRIATQAGLASLGAKNTADSASERAAIARASAAQTSAQQAAAARNAADSRSEQSAINRAAQAVRDKDLSVRVDVRTGISIHNIISGSNTVKTIYRTQS